MKLLSWMHRKSMPHNNEPWKNFTIGNSCACFPAQPSLDEQQYNFEPSYSAHLRPKGECQKLSKEFKAHSVGAFMIEESPTIISELFPGFLAIGTLGSDPIITEPITPTFPTPFENLIEKETEITENELKLVNEELEKFFEAEVKQEGHESSQRSSHDSIITLSGKQTEGTEGKVHGGMAICPLQGYLFGSVIELPEKGSEVKKEKTSLGELFYMSNSVQGHSSEKSDRNGKHGKGAYPIHFMKNMLKKIHLSPGSCKASAIADIAAPVSNKRKVSKVLRMFHRKIHPENSTDQKESSKSELNKHGANYNGHHASKGKNKKRPSQRYIMKEDYSNLNLHHEKPGSSGFTQNREYWIKTDADYLVLEL